MALTRRDLIKSMPIAGLGALAFSPAFAQSAGLVPNADADQTAALQAALEVAAGTTGHLFLPAGRYRTGPLLLPSGLRLTGVPGASILVHVSTEPLLHADGAENILIEGLALNGSGAGGDTWHGGLIHIANASNVTLRDCAVSNTALNAIAFLAASGRIENCTIGGTAHTGIFAYDSAGLAIAGNTITDCGNGGIRVWRGEPGPDGTIVTDNRISGIDWTDGGNGQNGNGINVFRADGVIVSGNHISDCAFSAIRLNATNDTQITGNTCLSCREVAIFSEFSFSGSIVSANIVDGAAAGISMTNYNDGGRLASCTGNIVRNLFPRSETNPDLGSPYGIAAEADAIVADNLIDNVPGTGIVAGWGPYLRDVTITNNLVRDVDLGILVSVAPEAGPAIITGNTISGARTHALAGAAWWDVLSSNLAADAARFPQLTVAGNTVL